MESGLILYSYWRSSAAYRVRIGLNLKGLAYDQVAVHLLRDGGEQHGDAYRDLNPQELVPTLRHGERTLRQSLAILEYIDEAWRRPRLLPEDPLRRQQARALAQLVACDIHPLNNLRVLQYLDHHAGMGKDARDAWVRHWIDAGFRAAETLLVEAGNAGDFCFGEAPGVAECCLIPQIYNARRFDMDMSAYPHLARIDAACLALPAFEAARPENQPDAA